jgi:hypothetical protein
MALPFNFADTYNIVGINTGPKKPVISIFPILKADVVHSAISLNLKHHANT